MIVSCDTVYCRGLYLSTLSQNAPVETVMSEYHKIVPKVMYSQQLSGVYKPLPPPGLCPTRVDIQRFV